MHVWRKSTHHRRNDVSKAGGWRAGTVAKHAGGESEVNLQHLDWQVGFDHGRILSNLGPQATFRGFPTLAECHHSLLSSKGNQVKAKHITFIIAACALVLAGCAENAAPRANKAAIASAGPTVGFTEIRSAAIKVEYAGTTFLIDPMLASKGAYPAFPGTVNTQLRNPLVDFTMPLSEAIKADAVIVTHAQHYDHWDETARRSLPKDMPIFVQSDEDADSIRKDGFSDVRVLGTHVDFHGTLLSKTGGQHGSDAMVAGRGKRLGPVSGVVFERPGYKTVYVAGDTTWNRYVDDAIARYHPGVMVVNACYGRLGGYDGSFIMGKEDLVRASRALPGATVVASHMEALAHCTQTRQDLRDYIAEKGLDPRRVLVPQDGESYRF
jgi:L-ascorbate metabolism protein UlaG (beta-lactamase superfamily)